MFNAIKNPELRKLADIVTKHFALKREVLPKKLPHFSDLGQELPVDEGEPFTAESGGVQYFAWKVNGEIVTIEGTQV